MGDDKQREMRKTVFEGVGNFSYQLLQIVIDTLNGLGFACFLCYLSNPVIRDLCFR